MRIKSLTVRVLLATTLWSAVALIVIGVVISAIYRQSVERSFQNLLRALLHNVINSVVIGVDGKLSGSAQLSDLRFSQPRTGWYWIVDPLGKLYTDPLVSPSLGRSFIPIVPLSEVPFDSNYERFYSVKDEFGNMIQVAETEIVLDIDGRAARFRVSGNLDTVEQDVKAFSQSLYLSLGVFGVGSLLVNAMAILYGLKPLDKTRTALEDIRVGDAKRLEGDFPREILPLVNSVNALIESNQRIVERARVQVGNLAHSLKTPIAVLLNEANLLDGQQADLLRNQAEAMQAQVQVYLNRARIAARRESILVRTDAEEVLQRLVRVVGRLNPEKKIHLDVGSCCTIAMEQQDFEEVIGNLLENAARHSENFVRIHVELVLQEASGSDNSKQALIKVVIDDDGQGLKEDQMKEAIKRGSRLDESKPGAGLGLSIVSDIILEYKGTFELSRSDLGGLCASVVLPGRDRDIV
ncbi:Sensor histidine kinase [Liberibacter crescens BT-1]|uniref:histidine kinase n=1 Tax=Liberibacter crescens (strain BT-1) TaxID=1215343 RepID=L0EX55_LIBCB|nr:HAMP domain-containing sensor histidine kinase [Liberibacter crescens]AGA65243.1 Sensor histidine kinase [Liberibacter crescens BT-1]AMC13184.1 histidine kinase [Liberibacter crescens]